MAPRTRRSRSGLRKKTDYGLQDKEIYEHQIDQQIIREQQGTMVTNNYLSFSYTICDAELYRH